MQPPRLDCSAVLPDPVKMINSDIFFSYKNYTSRLFSVLGLLIRFNFILIRLLLKAFLRFYSYFQEPPRSYGYVCNKSF